MEAASFAAPLGRVHHYAYLVDGIESTVARLGEQLGAGPFFKIDDVPLEGAASLGEPAELRHHSAFGFRGEEAIELMEIAGAAPERVAAGFAGSRPSLHHLAWVVPRAAVDGTREELDRRQMPEYFHARFGEIDFTYHDAGALLGHDLEIHVDSEALQGFFAMFREAAEGWDGSDPLRPAMG